MLLQSRLLGVELQHRHKLFHLFIRPSGAFELHVDHCLRKRREHGPREPQYVWTNIELEWEEHHYIEARYWASSGALVVTVNGDLLCQGEVPEYAADTHWLRVDEALE